MAFSLKNKYHISIVGRKDAGNNPISDDKVNIISVPFITIPLLGAFITNIRIFLALRGYQFDAVIANPGLFLAAKLYKTFHRKTKIILDIRSVPVSNNMVYHLYLKKMLQRSLRSKILSGITIITEPMKDFIVKYYRVDLTLPVGIWSSGVNPALFHPIERSPVNYSKMKGNSTVIVYHGILDNRDLENLMMAVKFLIDDMCNVKLWLIGTGSTIPSLKKEAEKLKIENYIFFTGLIPYKEVPEILSVADVEVFPLPDRECYYYQSPLKIFECLAMGIPIITTDLPAHRNISEGIILIPDNQPVTIKNALLSFLNMDSKKRKYLSDMALRDSRNHTWESQAEILSEFLEKKIFQDHL